MSNRNLRQPKIARPFSRRCHGRRRGQAMVETGFVILILLVVSLCLIQYGLICNSVLALNNLTREGARFASVRSLATPADNDLKAQLITYLQARAAGTTISPNSINSSSVIIERPANTAGRELRVRINYNLKNKGFAPDLFPLPARFVNYQATAGNLIEN